MFNYVAFFYFNCVVHKYCSRYNLFVLKYCNIYLSWRYFLSLFLLFFIFVILWAQGPLGPSSFPWPSSHSFSPPSGGHVHGFVLPRVRQPTPDYMQQPHNGPFPCSEGALIFSSHLQRTTSRSTHMWSRSGASMKTNFLCTRSWSFVRVVNF